MGLTLTSGGPGGVLGDMTPTPCACPLHVAVGSEK